MDYKVYISADYFIEIMVMSRRIFCFEDFVTFLDSQRLPNEYEDFNTQVAIVVDDLFSQNIIKRYLPVNAGDKLYWCPEENTNIDQYNISEIIKSLRLDIESEMSEEDFVDTTINLICKIEDYLALMETDFEKVYIRK
jgi:hypothetical protein